MKPGQLIKLEKVCYGLVDGPLRMVSTPTEVHHHGTRLPTITRRSLYLLMFAENEVINNTWAVSSQVATDDLLHGGE